MNRTRNDQHARGRAARSGFAVVLGLAAVVATSPALADWPMARHDPGRSGAAPGKSDITDPIIGWRAYLGGSIHPRGLIAADVDGDGKNELVIATSGAVAVKRADDTLLWRTSTYDLAALLAVTDLDGDGKLEVVVTTGHAVRVFDAATGAVRWAQAPGEMGAVGTVRHGDVDGDGLPDLVVGECPSCGGGKQQTGYVYSFAGNLGAPKRMALPTPPPWSAGFQMTLVDMDGKPGAEILIGKDPSVLALVDGASGAVLATSPDLGAEMAQWSECLGADLDGVPGQEVVCVASASPEPVPMANDPSKVFALKLNAAAGSLDLLWTYTVPKGQALSNAYDDPLVDLDGDGSPEVVVTGKDAAGVYTTHVLRAATGLELASIPGSSYAGSAPLLGGKGQVILTNTPVNGSAFLGAWAFGPSPKVTELWSLQGFSPLTTPDWARLRVSSAANARVVAVDFDGNGIPELLALRGSDGQLTALSTGAGSVQSTKTLAFPADAPLIGVWDLPPVDEAYPQIGVAQANGVFHLLDKNLVPAAAEARFGGYYATADFRQLGAAPVVGAVDGTRSAPIYVRDSRGTLLKLDASKATADTPPVVGWESPSTFGPILVEGGGGAEPKVAAFVYYPENNAYTLRALRRDTGEPIWSYEVTDAPSNDLLSTDIDLDGVPDVIFQSSISNDPHLTTTALSGSDGHVIWSSLLNGCSLPAGMAIADWDGDKVPDVIQQGNGTHVASGQNGAEIASGGPGDCYFMPIPLDVDGDGVSEAVFTAGYSPASMYAHDLQTPIFAGTDDDRPYPYGSIASCADGPVLVEGSYRFSARLKMTSLAGGAQGDARTVVLADGKTYQDEGAAQFANAGLGQLTAANVHADLTGKGHPTALVGSTDGWLYAVDPCRGELDFAVSFGSAVGEAIFGDTDGDGRDEILVSVADGYLYALRNKEQGPPLPIEPGKKRPLEYLLNGRAGCGCEVGAGGGDGLAALLLGVGLLTARRRRRSAMRPAAPSPHAPSRSPEPGFARIMRAKPARESASNRA